MKIEIDGARAGITLSAAVRDALGLPWNRAKRACETGKVRVDGEVARDPALRLRAGVTVEIAWNAPRDKSGVLASDAIAYVDRDVIVVRKPAGILSVPYEEGDRDTLVDIARAALRKDASKGPQGASLGIVHRLDKDTTGLLVFARTLAAKRHLAQQFRQHTVGRRYLAIAHGEVAAAKHDSMFVRDRGDGLRGSHGVFRRAISGPPADARRAITHVRPLEPLAGATLVECRLETGRQHQIRIHLAEAGHPIVGERVYVRDHAGPRIDAPRSMLHAASLAFDHPRLDRRIELEEPLPADFEQVLTRLRRRP